MRIRNPEINILITYSISFKAIEEIINSEKSYLRHLELLEEYFMNPIRNDHTIATFLFEIFFCFEAFIRIVKINQLERHVGNSLGNLLDKTLFLLEYYIYTHIYDFYFSQIKCWWSFRESGFLPNNVYASIFGDILGIRYKYQGK